MKTQRTRATIARGTLEAGRGVPPCSPARFRLSPSTLVLLAGLIGGCGVLAAGAPQLAGAAVLAGGLIGGLALRGWEERRTPGRRCRVCGAHEALDLRMWAARDLCVPCSERRCRACGCTDERACMELDLLGDCAPCHWVEPDLCSTCAVDSGDPSVWADPSIWDFRECQQCGGAGALLVCIDDMCHAQGWCMHGDGMETCPECRGTGRA